MVMSLYRTIKTGTLKRRESRWVNVPVMLHNSRNSQSAVVMAIAHEEAAEESLIADFKQRARKKVDFLIFFRYAADGWSAMRLQRERLQ